MNGEIIPPLKGVSPELNSLVLKACANCPTDRFASPTHLRKALEAIAQAENYGIDESRNAAPAVNHALLQHNGQSSQSTQSNQSHQSDLNGLLMQEPTETQVNPEMPEIIIPGNGRLFLNNSEKLKKRAAVLSAIAACVLFFAITSWALVSFFKNSDPQTELSQSNVSSDDTSSDQSDKSEDLLSNDTTSGESGTTNPNDPNDPGNQSDPANPADPGKTADPNTPAGPTTPADPNNPATPSQTVFTVTYNFKQNGGTSATRTSAVLTGGSIVDLSPTATKPASYFIGWNTSKDATAKLSAYTMPAANVTLYAIFKGIPVANNDSFSMPAGQGKENSPYNANIMTNDEHKEGSIVWQVKGTSWFPFTSEVKSSGTTTVTLSSGSCCETLHRVTVRQNGSISVVFCISSQKSTSTFQYQLRNSDGVISDWATVTIIRPAQSQFW
jgi:hypothetical protein